MYTHTYQLRCDLFNTDGGMQSLQYRWTRNAAFDDL